MDYTELIERCEFCINSLCGECEYGSWQETGDCIQCMHALISDAANAIKDLSAFVNRLKDGHVYGYKDGILYEAKVREPDNTIIRPLPQLRRAET